MDDIGTAINYQIPDTPQVVGAPTEEIAQPSFGLTEAATAFNAIATGTSNTLGQEFYRFTTNNITDRNRPYLNQDQVNKLWQDNNLPDKPIDATKYNDVGVYEMLDLAKRRQAANEVNEATPYGLGTIPRVLISLGIGVADPANLITGLFPAGSAFKAIWLTKTAAGIEALRGLGTTATTLTGRVAARAATGAIEASVGNVLLEGVTAPLRDQQGQDFSAADSLLNIGLGAAIGSGLHVVGGALAPVHNAVNGLQPETREGALTAATAQLENDKFPQVDTIVRSDGSIGTANPTDITSQLKESTKTSNDIDTHDIILNDNVEAKPVQVENENFDYEAGISEQQAKQKEIQSLSDQGLYSDKVEQPVTPMEQVGDIAKLQSDTIDTFTNARNELQKAAFNPEEKYSQWFTDKILDEQAGSHSVALAEQVNKIFGDDGLNLLKTGKIKIVDDVSQLKGTHPDTVKGVTFSDGQVYLVANNITPETARGVVLHEIGVHAAGLNDVMKGVSNQVSKLLDSNEQLKGFIEHAVRDVPEKYKAEERLAYLVETAPELPVVQKIFSQIKSWLYENFPSLRSAFSLTQNDLANLALSSLRTYARKGTSGRVTGTAHYSQDVNPYETIDNELAQMDTALKGIDNRMNEMLKDAQSFVDIGDPKMLADYMRQVVGGITDKEATAIYKSIDAAYYRAKELSMAEPEKYAIKYTFNKLKYNLEKYKTGLIHDRAIKQKLVGYLNKNWATLPKHGIESLLIGTMRQRENSRLYTMGDNMQFAKQLWHGRFLADLKGQGLDSLFMSGAVNDDVTRAMWLLEDGMDVSHLSKESVSIAKSIMKVYDGQIKSLNDNGFVTNKVPHYITNQKSVHNVTKILNAGYDQWHNDVARLLDYRAMAEQMNIKPSDVEGLLPEMYHGLSTGEHVGNHGSIGGKFTPFTSPLAKITEKQRKIIFKDADSLIEYRNKYGTDDFHSSVLSTIESTARKVAMAQTLGVNYERNLRELVQEFTQSVPTPEGRVELEKYANTTMMAMLKSVDGRCDIPVSEAMARFFGNWRAVITSAKLGGAAISSMSDLASQARYMTSRGMGGYLYNILKQTVKLGQKFSPEKKQMLSALGVFNDSQIRDVYRDGNADMRSGWVTKATSMFMKATLLPMWTEHSRLNALDSLMHYVSGFADRPMSKLDPATQKEFSLFGIGEQEWEIMRKANLQQIDGNKYLIPEELDRLHDVVKSKLSLSDEAATRYINGLKQKLTTMYSNGLAHMVNEPSAYSHYLQTGGGRFQAGTPVGEIGKMMTQFKSFTFEFIRSVLGDQVYQNNDSLLGKNGFLLDTSKKGLQSKMNLGKFIAASAIIGYMSMSIKDILNGKKPRPIIKDGSLDGKTLIAALLQGGGLGIYGDFLFGNLNRFGGSFIETLTGAGSGQISDLHKLYSGGWGAATNYDPKQGKQLLAQGIQFVKQNTPFINLFYTKAALDYLIFNNLQEYLNPGYLRRLEQNIKNNNDQEYYLSPSQVAQSL